MQRAAVLIIVLVFIVGFGGLTLDYASHNGVDVVDVLALLVLALMLFGVVGALLQPPEK